MTFLDTVDGKLARVTVTSSKLGNKLDHVTDMVHPPIWWVCLAIGIAEHAPAAAQDLLLLCVVILAAYVVGRLIETLFKKTIGYNAYLWQPFDSHFRLIVARRNTILLIMTVGIIAGAAVEAYVVSAIWSVISGAIQILRYVQARQALRKGNASSWLM
jgi:phosphatidylglycerophosphate synthase